MVKSEGSWSGVLVTLGATGALSAPSVGPVGTLYVNGAASAASVSVTGSNPYKWSVLLPVLAAGDCVDMYVTATIDGVATAAIVATDTIDEILDGVVEGTTTLRQMLRLLAAALFGDMTLTGSTVTFKDLAATKARITATLSSTARDVTALDGT